MEQRTLSELLQALFERTIDVEEAMKRLSDMPFHDLGFAKVDHHRPLRTGYPEIIFCQGKSAAQVTAIAGEQIKHGETVFGTRASEEIIGAVERQFGDIEVNRTGRCFWKKSAAWTMKEDVKGTILIVSAGTADASVVEEARCTVDVLGHPCSTLQDVGVAGIHRLFAHREELLTASVIIVVAGMEGALPSVVAGLVRCPVIGVPTSVGYGAHLDGMVPLFAMLNSCAAGLTVVNIDNGFGAACAAVRINTR